ncbi:MAG: DUF4389 domain-containing protein [Actinobacteria bacterium]|jgi:hypothetical protein|uniref:Unannotated protein n=1 Tax=freshwater metagenome TaxID=449393 RepID=A0A6J7VFG8_9ZZZZ|nr:DUF4389 domain-containing protein [Actinomycetota bacterium]
MSQQIETSFKVQLDNRNRSTVIWRAILVAPVAFFASSFTVDTWDNNGNAYSYGLLVLPVILALLFRGTYPSYVLSFNKALFGLVNRVWAYFSLLTDSYPSIEESDAVSITYPDIDGGKSLSRGLPLIKWAMAIPLYIVGIVYAIYGIVLIILGWFSILLNGSLPDYCADGIVRTSQYWNRVYGYAILLVTDEYPSFNL